MIEIEGDVLAAKRSHEDDDTSGGVSDGTSGTSPSIEKDADFVVRQKRRCRGAYHKRRPLRKNNPPAFTQLSLALKSELKKLQQVAARGSGVSRAGWDKSVQCCNLPARPLIWQQRAPRTRQIGEDSTSLKSSQWMPTTMLDMWKTRHRLRMTKAQMKT